MPWILLAKPLILRKMWLAQTGQYGTLQSTNTVQVRRRMSRSGKNGLEIQSDQIFPLKLDKLIETLLDGNSNLGSL